MKTIRFTESQIVGVPNEAEAGVYVAEIMYNASSRSDVERRQACEWCDTIRRWEPREL